MGKVFKSFVPHLFGKSENVQKFEKFPSASQRVSFSRPSRTNSAGPGSASFAMASAVQVNKPKFVVLEHSLTNVGRKLSERREARVAKDRDGRLKIQASITRAIDGDVVVYDSAKHGDEDVTTRVKPKLVDRSSHAEFAADWGKYWQPKLEKRGRLTPLMNLVTEIEPTCEEAYGASLMRSATASSKSKSDKQSKNASSAMRAESYSRKQSKISRLAPGSSEVKKGKSFPSESSDEQWEASGRSGRKLTSHNRIEASTSKKPTAKKIKSEASRLSSVASEKKNVASELSSVASKKSSIGSKVESVASAKAALAAKLASDKSDTSSKRSSVASKESALASKMSSLNSKRSSLASEESSLVAAEKKLENKRKSFSFNGDRGQEVSPKAQATSDVSGRATPAIKRNSRSSAKDNSIPTDLTEKGQVDGGSSSMVVLRNVGMISKQPPDDFDPHEYMFKRGHLAKEASVESSDNVTSSGNSEEGDDEKSANDEEGPSNPSDVKVVEDNQGVGGGNVVVNEGISVKEDEAEMETRHPMERGELQPEANVDDGQEYDAISRLSEQIDQLRTSLKEEIQSSHQELKASLHQAIKHSQLEQNKKLSSLRKSFRRSMKELSERQGLNLRGNEVGVGRPEERDAGNNDVVHTADVAETLAQKPPEASKRSSVKVSHYPLKGKSSLRSSNRETQSGGSVSHSTATHWDSYRGIKDIHASDPMRPNLDDQEAQKILGERKTRKANNARGLELDIQNIQENQQHERLFDDTMSVAWLDRYFYNV